jgi:hypothetical protein
MRTTNPFFTTMINKSEISETMANKAGGIEK